jgi:hypothetical protein
MKCLSRNFKGTLNMSKIEYIICLIMFLSVFPYKCLLSYIVHYSLFNELFPIFGCPGPGPISYKSDFHMQFIRTGHVELKHS